MKTLLLLFSLIIGAAVQAQITVVPQQGHSGIVKFAVYSPDNRFLYTISEDGQIICWDLSTSRMLEPLKGMAPGIKAKAIHFANNNEFLVFTNQAAVYFGNTQTTELKPFGDVVRSMGLSEGCNSSEYFVALVPFSGNDYRMVLYYPLRGAGKKIFYSPDVEKLIKDHIDVLRYDKDLNALFIGDETGRLVMMNAADQTAVLLKDFKKQEIERVAVSGNSLLVETRSTGKHSDKTLYWLDLNMEKRKVRKSTVLKKKSRVVFCETDKTKQRFILGETDPATYRTKVRYIKTKVEYETVHSVYYGKYNKPIQVVAISPSGDFMAMMPFNDEYTIWNIKAEEMVQTLHNQVHRISDFCWDPRSKRLFTFNSGIMNYSVNDLSAADYQSFPLAIKRTGSFCFTPDGTFFYTDLHGKKLYYINPQGIADSMVNPFSHLWDLNVNPNHSLILCPDSTGHLMVWNCKTKKELYRLSHKPGLLSGNMHWHVGGDHFSYSELEFGADDTVFFYNTESGELLGRRIMENLVPDSLGTEAFYSLSSDGKILYVSTEEMDIENDRYIYRFVATDFESGRILKVIETPGGVKTIDPGRKKGELLLQMKYLYGRFSLALFSEDDFSIKYDTVNYGSLLGKISWLDSNRYWNYTDNDNFSIYKTVEGDFNLRKWGESAPDYQFFSDNTGFLMLSSNGTVFCTKGASDFIAYQYMSKEGYKMVPGVTYEAQSNKPHLVLSELNVAEQSLIEMYDSAYQRRMARIDNRFSLTTKDELPECKAMLIDGTLYTSSRLHNFTIKWKSVFRLKHIFMDHNGTLINYDTAIRNAVWGSGSAVLRVVLAPGVNRLTFYVTDDRGVNSLPEYREVSVDRAYWDYSTIYYIGIGVSSYENKNFNLNYAAKDIRDMAGQFYKAEYVVIDTFINEQALWDSIVRVKQRLANLYTEDRVIISFSGHGMLSNSLDLYLGLHNMDFDHPEKNGLLFDSLVNLLNQTPALQKLLLIDACHSGEIDKEGKILVKADTTAGGARGSSIVLNKNARKMDVFQFMKNHFEDGISHNGAVVISAAGGEEYALELRDLENGVFTHVLLDCLQKRQGDKNGDGKISVSELRDYLIKEVPEITHNRQQPTVRSENQLNDWILWDE